MNNSNKQNVSLDNCSVMQEGLINGKGSGIKAMFTLFRFCFYPFLLMKTLPAHIVPFLNEYAMKTIGAHTAPAKRCCRSPFQYKAFVRSCQEGTNHEFECHCNHQPINKGM